MSACTKCGRIVGDDGKFCKYCGTMMHSEPVPNPKPAGAICESCGRTVGPDERFCKNCGASIVGGAPIVSGARVSTASDRNDKSSYVLGIIAICFAAIGAAWSFIGGVCCGWAGWGWAFIGLVLAIISLALKPSTIGWWALGLAIFAFAWLVIASLLLAASVSNWAPGY